MPAAMSPLVSRAVNKFINLNVAEQVDSLKAAGYLSALLPGGYLPRPSASNPAKQGRNDLNDRGRAVEQQGQRLAGGGVEGALSRFGFLVLQDGQCRGRTIIQDLQVKRHLSNWLGSFMFLGLWRRQGGRCIRCIQM